MQVSIAKSKNIRVSPYKLRPYADVIRGKSFVEALAYLKAHEVKKVRSIIQVLLSAYANARSLQKSKPENVENLFVEKIFVDAGSMLKYYKPAAMGRAAVQRRRLSHLTVVLGNNKN